MLGHSQKSANRKLARIALLCSSPICSLGLTSCANETRYEDPGAVETIDERFGQTDLHLIATEMSDSFLATQVWEGEQPRIVMGGVKNRTRQHLDTKNITDTIRTAFVQSGKFSVLAGDQGIGEIQQETAYQQSGAVDVESAVQLGQQLGAEYVFYGRFTEIAKSKDRVRSRFMKFTLNAVNVQTRQITWAEEKEISKITEKALLGW